MPLTNEYGDGPSADVVASINRLLAAHPNVNCYIKWTCPACGERAMSNRPNTFNQGGYYHEEKRDGTLCGALYTGDLYGYAAIIRR